MVAGYAAKELVERGVKPGEVLIVSRDKALPYERPPLSKGFLAGKEDEQAIRINPDSYYRERGIDVRLETKVARVDPKTKIMVIASGGQIGFENLVIATGARPKKLDVPGADLKGVYYLRTIQDSKRIRDSVGSMDRVLVVGGSFIAMEVASVFAQKGIQTTMVMPEDRVWQRFFTPSMSSFFERYYSARGVRFAKHAKITELRGQGSVSSAAVEGSREIPCDMVVAGVGVEPVMDMLEGSGIETGDGVLVNEYLETNCSGVYAAGDVANFPDASSGRRRRIEHWDNAVSQGQHVARTLMGDRQPFVHVPYFFSDNFDLSWEFWGDVNEFDQTVERGDMKGTSFSVWWLRAGQVVAAFVMNRPDEEREAAPRWIERKQPVMADRLADPETPIASAT
jgi:3-phenylpropionate/trans-cinnamate dioxygenase ferredoxin reductase component